MSAQKRCSTSPGRWAATAFAKRTASSWQPKVYFTQAGNTPRVAEAIQVTCAASACSGSSALDSTIAPAKMAEQDYEIWSVNGAVSVGRRPHDIYFDSKNIPTPKTG